MKSTGETSGNALTVENREDKRIEERAHGTVGIIGREIQIQTGKDRVLELWEERTSEETL
jgi:hypothetical protein